MAASAALVAVHSLTHLLALYSDAPPVPAALVDRGKHGVLHRADRDKQAKRMVISRVCWAAIAAKLLTRDEAGVGRFHGIIASIIIFMPANALSISR